MTIKGMISNPILNKTGTTLFLDKPHQKDDSVPLLRKSSRTYKPSFTKNRLSTFIQQPLMHRRRPVSEPIIHYNGPCETLDQLPEDKYQWIASESFDMNDQPTNPLLNYPRSIVLRKPHHIHAAAFKHRGTQKPKAKGTFYIRAYPVRPSITVEDEVFYGSYATSQKCGKIGTQAIMDETYLIDFYGETKANLTIYSHSNNLLGSISSHFKRPEQSLGSHEFQITLKPTEKKVERITLKPDEAEEPFQVLVVYGTFVSPSVMRLLKNETIYKGYITVYTKGRAIPRWNRHWAILTPEGFELYDFEYKERRKALYKVPLSSFLKIFHPPIDDDERLVDVGSLGLALQFAENVQDQAEDGFEAIENRLYILPDDQKSSQEWENAFTQVATLINEFRFDQCFHATRLNSENKPVSISNKFLW
ncbi:hypothetical protein BY458DRAFT_444543 [Sporodiniella umbellata]|nr:hypothetical protein BY458DRAFT_444543 [Sporodiniella umbellata]